MAQQPPKPKATTRERWKNLCGTTIEIRDINAMCRGMGIAALARDRIPRNVGRSEDQRLLEMSSRRSTARSRAPKNSAPAGHLPVTSAGGRAPPQPLQECDPEDHVPPRAS